MDGRLMECTDSSMWGPGHLPHYWSNFDTSDYAEGDHTLEVRVIDAQNAVASYTTVRNFDPGTGKPPLWLTVAWLGLQLFVPGALIIVFTLRELRLERELAICPSCGAETGKGAYFCGSCGASLHIMGKQQEEEEVYGGYPELSRRVDRLVVEEGVERVIVKDEAGKVMAVFPASRTVVKALNPLSASSDMWRSLAVAEMTMTPLPRRFTLVVQRAKEGQPHNTHRAAS
jgi:hypothetical protein